MLLILFNKLALFLFFSILAIFRYLLILCSATFYQACEKLESGLVAAGLSRHIFKEVS